MKTYVTDNLPKMDDHTQQLVYCSLDSMLTVEIEDALNGRMDSVARKTYEFERSNLGPILSMMNRGFLVDEDMKQKVIAELTAKVTLYQKALVDFVQVVWPKPDFNYRSNLQLQELFYRRLLIPEQISSKKGKVKTSLDRDALERVGKEYPRAEPFAHMILLLRDEQKVIDALSTTLKNQRWHCSYNIGGTDSGRLSSSEHPLRIGANIQNVDDYIRRAFVADPGHVLYSCDQQGAEARAVAYLSGDPNYIAALEAGDVHTIVASMVFGFAPDKALAERKYYRDMSYRDIAKRAAHGSNYNGSARTIAKVLKVETAVIEEFQAKYFKAFPKIRKWQEWTALEIQSKGCLTTPFGRRRYVWNRAWDDATIRAAIAYVPQSTVSDLTLTGMLNLWRLYDPELQLLANGHDAAILQVPKGDELAWKDKILAGLTTPLSVTDISGTVRQMVVPWEASIGLSWGKRITLKDGTVENPLGLMPWNDHIKIGRTL
jgi:DNA polymerase-1